MHLRLLCSLLLVGCVPPSSVLSEPTDRPDLAIPLSQPVADSWLPASIGYEIFVRSFADSGSDGNGDLVGIRDRLPYLQSLGVNLIWLTPIHPSPSYHGYDVADYDAVHPDFGTLADLDALIADAHSRGMRLLLGLVINHTSKTHPWFVAAKGSSPSSMEAQRYLFRSSDPGFLWMGNKVFRPLDGQPGRYYYGLFSSVMPDLNFRDPPTVQSIEQMAQRWLSRGVDGFRLDAARYLVETPDPLSATTQPVLSDTAETHQVWQRLRKNLTAQHPHAALIGEVWSDHDTIASYFAEGKELHGALHFPIGYAMIDGLKKGTAKPVRDALEQIAKGSVPSRYFAPFLTNHDQKRLATELGGDVGLLKAAAALLLGMPGTPFLYYGEEIGLAQSSAPGDRGQRPALPWDVVQKQSDDPDSLLSYYRRLGQLRRNVPGLRAQRLQMIWPQSPDDRLLAFSRGDGKDAVLVVWNLGTAALSGVKLALPSDFPLGKPSDLLSGLSLSPISTENRGSYPLPTLPPKTGLWIVPGG